MKYERHGLSHISEYNTWTSMRARCINPKCDGYSYYGGRGIKVCDRWLNSFVAFIEDMGMKSNPKYTLERIDNNRGYEKANCKWASPAQQSINRRNSILIEYNGRNLVLKHWAQELNISYLVLLRRLKKMSFEQAVAIPVRKRLITRAER